MRQLTKTLKTAFLYTCFTIIFFQLLTTSCAREMTPPGGPKDTIPPRILKSYPQPLQTNFKDKKIILKFNEFFELKNIDKEFFVSPPFPHRPKFAIRGKKLIIKLKDRLRDSVTYTFEFGNSIVDYTEGNALENFKLIFSTYDQIDTLRMSGKVLDGATYEPQEGIYVMLYKKNTPDSVVYRQAPMYVTVTDKEGKFQIVGIKKGCYKLVAINDFNKNFIYDGIENEIGFLDRPICVNAKIDTIKTTLTAGTVLHDSISGKIIDTLKKDTTIIKTIVKYTPKDLIIRLFTEQTRPQQVTVTKRLYPFLCIIRFSYPLHKNYYKIKPLQGKNNDYIYHYDPQTDSLDIWIKNKNISNKDTLGFIITYLSPKAHSTVTKLDTVYLYTPQNTNYFLNISSTSKEIAPYDSVVLRSNVYIKHVDSRKAKLLQIIDTAFFDPKNVQVKAIRVEPDEIDIFFSRPLVTHFNIWLNNINIDNKNIKTNRPLTEISVPIPQELVDQDTIYLNLNYWVNRFYNYQEFHRISIPLVLSRQQIISTKRINWDSLALTFAKPVKNLELKCLDSKIKWMQINPFTIAVKLLSPQDTIKLKVRTLDFARLSAEPIYFEQNLSIPYKWTPNKIKTVARVNRGRVIMIFDRPPTGIFMINSLDPNVKGSDNSFILNHDTLSIDFKSKEFKRLKVNKIIIGFYDLNKAKPIKIYDTVTAEIGENPLLKKTEIFRSQSFSLSVNHTNPLELVLKSNFAENSKYQLLLLPQSITDIIGNKNDSVYVVNFETTKNKNFGSLKIHFTDDSQYFTSGQLIMEFMDQKGNTVYNFTVKDTVFEASRLKPGDYQIKITFDRNKNDRWDTGNYLRHLQPEKVVILPQKISVKSNWKIEESISLKSLEKL